MIAEMLQSVPLAVRPGLSSDNHQSFGSQASIELGQMMVDRLGEKEGASALSTNIRTYKDEFHPSQFLVISQVSLGVGKGVKVENKLKGQEEVVDTIFSAQGEPAETWLWEGEAGGKVYQEVLDIYHTVASSNEDMTAVWVSYRGETERNTGQNVRIYKLEKKRGDAVLTSYTAGGSESSMWNFMDNITGGKYNRSSSLSGTAAFFNPEKINHQKVFNTLVSSLDDQEMAKSKDILQRFSSEMHMSDEERTLLNAQKEEAIKKQLEEEMLTNEDVKTAYALVAQAVAASVEETQTNRNQPKYNSLDSDTTSLVEVERRQTTVEKKPLETEVEGIKEANQPIDTEIFSREVVDEVKREEQDQERKADREEIREDKNIDNNAQIAVEVEGIKISDEPIQEVKKPEPLDSHEEDVERVEVSAKENGEIKSPVKTLLALYAQYISNYEVENQPDSQDKAGVIDQSEETISENNISRQAEKEDEQLPEEKGTTPETVLQVVEEIERFIEQVEQVEQVEEAEREHDTPIDFDDFRYKKLAILLTAYTNGETKDEVKDFLLVLIIDQLGKFKDLPNLPAELKIQLNKLAYIKADPVFDIEELKERIDMIIQSSNTEAKEDRDTKLIGVNIYQPASCMTEELEHINGQEEEDSLSKLLSCQLLETEKETISLARNPSISEKAGNFLFSLVYQRLKDVMQQNEESLPSEYLTRLDSLNDQAPFSEELTEALDKSVYQAVFGQLFPGDEVRDLVINIDDSENNSDRLRANVLAVIETDLESVGLTIDNLVYYKQNELNNKQIIKSVLIVVFLDLYQFSFFEKERILQALNISRDEIKELDIYKKIITRLNLLVYLCHNLSNRVNPEGILFERNRLMKTLVTIAQKVKKKSAQKRKKGGNKIYLFPKKGVIYRYEA